MFKEISIRTGKRTHFIDITDDVTRAVLEFNMADGAVAVYVPHTTAGITMNESADPNVVLDIQSSLEKLIPWDDRYSHSEGNAAAHIKSSLIGSAVTIPVRRGRLYLGSWQGIFFTEFDGPRTRRVMIAGLSA